MRIISTRKIKEFYETKGNESSKDALICWCEIIKKAKWNNFADIKNDFRSVDYIGNQRYIFNIKGNNYRLVVAIKFTIGSVFVRWIGTHKEYDKIDCQTI